MELHRRQGVRRISPRRQTQQLSLGHRRSASYSGHSFSISLAISLAFAFFGAWLVLPFAGVEMGVLVAGRFVTLQRHAADFRESGDAKGIALLVERWDRGKMSRFELNRYWAQVVLHRA
jgi:uncharacterized membrane protein